LRGQPFRWFTSHQGGTQLVFVDAMGEAMASVREVQVYGASSSCCTCSRCHQSFTRGGLWWPLKQSLLQCDSLHFKFRHPVSGAATSLLHIASKSSSLTATRGRIEGQAGQEACFVDAMVGLCGPHGNPEGWKRVVACPLFLKNRLMTTYAIKIKGGFISIISVFAITDSQKSPAHETHHC
jgi:hypothetical protein